ncbi:MAG: alpha/beta hydrolase [Ferruginibacter sp.]|nr:alpha/beta hydrolase [Ferruginibacter sp.]
MTGKTKKRLRLSFLIFLACWIVFAQSCMKFRISDNKAKEEFAQKGLLVSFRYTSADNTGVHYAKAGNDSLPTLFFVHGSPGSWDAFKIYMMDTSLLRHFRIISVDRPGFGYTGFGTALRLEEQCLLINKVVEKENNHKPLHLVGHSIGGPVIVHLAQKYPEEFASLTILAGSISPYEEPKEYWRYLFMYTPLKILMPGAFRPSNDEIIYFKKDLYHIDTMYEAIKIPVTFIHGDKDKFVTVKNVEYGKNKLTHNVGVNAIIINGAGHFIPWEYFDLIKKHLLLLDTTYAKQ